MAAGSGAKGGGKGAASKICFHFRDHGNCPKGDSCPFSHDKELRKQALAAKRGESTLAAKGGKGGGKGGGKAGAARPSRRPPLSRRRSLLARSARSSRRRVRAGRERTVSLPAADPKGAVREHALALIRRARAAASRRSTSCRRLVVAGLWFRCWAAASSACSTGALGRTMSPRTEELLVGMLNRAAELGIGTEDPRFPVVKLEKWVHPEFVHGIASGAPVPLKGAAVLRVTLLEGKTPEEARAGPEIFVRCKIAARGSSDWHGLILGGRARALSIISWIR